jgi:hypothetical protein
MAAVPAAVPMRLCITRRKCNETENQSRTCEQFREPRHRFTSDATPATADRIAQPPRVLDSHQQRICGTMTGPLTRYSLTSQE